jgi:hypothetical protein
MLTTQSYLIAIAIYGLAAVAGVAMLRKLWFSSLSGLSFSHRVVCSAHEILKRETVGMKFEGTERYVATDDLRMAVNASVALAAALLIKGEPGTGKTMLAEEVAAGLGKTLIQWHIKSTTKAQQGLYEYDAVSRLARLAAWVTARSRMSVSTSSAASSGRHSLLKSRWCC